MSNTDYEDLVIENYSLAPSGQGPLASEWEDKPHRLVYDLCSALTSLLKERDELKEALVDMLDEYDGVYDSSGTVEGRAPYQSERAKEACEKARSALASAPGSIEEPQGEQDGTT